MPILALGVSHRHASIELLERLAFAGDDLPKAYRRLREMEAVQGGVLLSTCNRVEVYAEVASYHAGFLDLKRFLCEAREVDPDDLGPPLYSQYEDHAAEHLFSVASGIESMVIGEPQILTQVRQAHLRSEAEGASTPLLSALLRGAIRTGRRARAETAIGVSPAAFVSAGADAAARELGDLRGRPAVVVGAGGMAELAALELRDRGFHPLRILNRSVERAHRLASRAGPGAQGGGLDGLVAAIARSDLVVCSTGAAGVVVSASTVARALELRAGLRGDAGPLVMLDLAVPRDVDPLAGDLPGVRIIGVEGLKAEVARRPGATDVAAEVERVRDIVGQEVARFAAWRRATRLAPLIAALQERGASIQAAELARVRTRLAHLSEREWEAVETLAGSIVAKLLHEPIVRLKELSSPGAGDAAARTLAELFGLDARPGG